MSQPNTSRIPTRKSAAPTSTIEDLNHLTSKVVKYILERSRTKYAIRATNIKKHVLKNRQSDFRHVIADATDKFNRIFGYELIHIQGAQYFIVNKFLNDDITQKNSQESAEQTLLFLTLSFIFMCSETQDNAMVKEDDLWQFFYNLNILNENQTNHPYFGNVKELITTKFVKQLYLGTSKTRETDVIMYQWGPRADAEITRRSILQFVSKVYNRPLESWAAQYRTMKNSERSALQAAE